MTTDETNGPPGHETTDMAGDPPRGYAQYTAQITFFTDSEQANALGRAKILVSRSRAEIIREALDMMLPTMVTEYRSGRTHKPTDRPRGTLTEPINFNAEPSLKELVETLAAARGEGKEAREALSAVVREAIDRALPKLTGAKLGNVEARTALRAALTERPGAEDA